MINYYLRKIADKVRGKIQSIQIILHQPQKLLHSEMRQKLSKIMQWQDKIKFFENYEYSVPEGAWLLRSLKNSLKGGQESNRIAIQDNCSNLIEGKFNKINYGCGSTIIDRWLNVDIFPADLIKSSNYCPVNLLDKHPFADNSIQFGFAEDVIEHFGQAESIFFLGEVYRALMLGGVLRLSFPGLEGVLIKHYSPSSPSTIRYGEVEAYSIWDHYHFYSKAELELISKHLGFSRVEYVEYGVSFYEELSGLDTRSEQIGLNTYVELTK